MEKKDEKTKVYNVIIMDRSGSMWDIQRPAIMGYNEVLGGVKAAAIKKRIEHLKKQGWSFAYMGTDHDVEGVTVSLSITNVIKFEKTAEETVKTFKRERRARERYLKEVDDFNHAVPCATMETRVAFNASLAEKYYEEEKED
jgi:hypothetical protein